MQHHDKERLQKVRRLNIAKDQYRRLKNQQGITEDRGFPGGASGKETDCQDRRCKRHEEKMATFSSILAWRISWTEEPSRLQS